MHEVLSLMFVAVVVAIILKSGGKKMQEIKVTLSLQVLPPPAPPLVVVAPDGSEVGDGGSVSLPPATVGVAYDYQVTIKGGTPPDTLTASGTLPDGLQMDSTGHITGTPTAAGSGTIVLDVKDSGQ